ncbi:hypothetical protein PAXRUDRAFT_132508 [Paxillus rubicundulus Ve08.2h10]|uniref:Uncharacterized protein n=1 Tax=Paxillus rubicundulus Ve08.2h10 TaxID=930991 RepID=A0A0D0DVY9_9AGAM|nr:hypothetical protein PAXRUDRAFT_132508 [Paxillus rubicundulus Ve08.2h10]
MDRWVSTVQTWNPLFQPPKHSGNGLLNSDDLPNGWEDPSICLNATLFNLCYPSLAPCASLFLFCSFSRTVKIWVPLQLAHLPTYNYLTSTHSIPTPTAISILDSVYLFDPLCHALVYKPDGSGDVIHHGLAYKPVSKKAMAVPAPLSERFLIICHLPNDCFAGLKSLPTKPPDFVPGTHFTVERAETLDLDPAKCLQPEELKFI